MKTSRRFSWGASLGAMIPCLLAGVVTGSLLRSRPEPIPVRPPLSKAASAPGPSETVPEPRAAQTQAPAAPKTGGTSNRTRTLGARLGEFMAAARKTHALLTDEKSPKDLDRRLQELRSSLGDLGELREAALSDPAGYLAFLKDPANEDVLGPLFCLLGRSPDPAGSLPMMDLAKIPRLIVDGLYDLLAVGTLGQKMTLLRNFETLAQCTSPEAPAREEMSKHCVPLLSASEDPRVRAEALGVLEAWGGGPLDPYLGLVRELWQKSSDPDVRADCLRALGKMKGPEAEELLLERSRVAIRESAAASDDGAARAALWVLQERAASIPLESAGRYVDVWALAFRETRRPEFYLEWLDGSTSLPAKHLGPLLEQAVSYAPTPELQASARRLLDAVRSGETRIERLRPMVFEKN